MAGRLGLLEVVCDAPPYAIVRGCRQVGFRTPEDVRWCRLSHFLQEDEGGKWFNHPAWKLLFGTRAPHEKACTCGHDLPPLARCTFGFACGVAAHYALGQCPRCRTIFWEEMVE